MRKNYSFVSTLVSMTILFSVSFNLSENCHNPYVGDGAYNLSTCSYEKTLAVDSEDTDNVDESRRDFKYEYFRGLTDNFGENVFNSCGYVAIGQLLSYYDTYLDDNIIDDKYDIQSFGDGFDMISRHNSPGVLNDPPTISLTQKSPSLSYLNYLKSVRDQSFQAELICQGNELGYFNTSYSIDNCCRTNFEQRMELLDYYLAPKDITYDFVYIDSQGESSKSDEVRKFTIEQIKKGNPVLLNIGYFFKPGGGHVAIAYDYDEEKDEVYCHMGWHDGSDTHQTPESKGMPCYYGALIIDFDSSSHRHSNNYVVFDGDNSKGYCYNNSKVKTYYNHQYNYELVYWAQFDKIWKCDCGETKEDKLIFKPSLKDLPEQEIIIWKRHGLN